MNQANDLALLRRFEPIIRYTQGEIFFPMDVAAYVRACSLWVQTPHKEATCLASARELTLERLAEAYFDELGSVRYLKLAEPLTVTELAAYTLRARAEHAEFHVGRGRLARVGYLSRLVDALFSITLLARGRVPGDSAAAADLIYKQILDQREHYRYYGRVVRENGWIVLQYWFFYLYNNWRTRFYGANDHESDWEMVCIYLSEDEVGQVEPNWVAYASHDYSGDDLRRRWDDPELRKQGEHPIIFAGAGSHASYFTPGEYLTQIELPFLSPVVKLAETAQKFWYEQLRQYGRTGVDPDENGAASIFRIPFVDYARGDGLSIGPGQAKNWESPGLLNPTPGWATNYRGLWGLYTHDPFAGEDAPAGPLYNRNGSMRQAWYDPVGWAGLDKVPTPTELLMTICEQKTRAETQQEALRREIAEKSKKLKGLGVEIAAMREQPHMKLRHEYHQQEIETFSATLQQLRAELAAEETLVEALDHYEGQVRAGQVEPARVHIQRPHQPTSEIDLKMSRLAEVWAAVSVGLMLIGFVVLGQFGQQFLTFWAVAVVGLFIFAESIFRGRVTNLVTGVTVGLALAAALVIFYEFFWQIVGVGVVVAGAYIALDNLRELRR